MEEVHAHAPSAWSAESVANVAMEQRDFVAARGLYEEVVGRRREEKGGHKDFWPEECLAWCEEKLAEERASPKRRLRLPVHTVGRGAFRVGPVR